MALTEPMTLPADLSDRMIWTFNMLMEVKVSAEDTGGALTAIDSWLTPAANPPMHVHHDQDESFVVLEGEVEFFLGSESQIARAGDFVFGPRGVPHRFEVRTPEARILVIGTPGGGERFFQALGEPAAAPTLPVPQEPDIPQVLAVAAENAIEILPPLPA